MLVAPIAHLAQITMEEANACLTKWQHAMGECHRPNGAMWAHALFENGEPIAVCVAAGLIRETCAGLNRCEAVELARLCAAGPHINRTMLRLWREMVFPRLADRHGFAWAISYQDERLHTGDTYRFDGWVRLARSRSGTDPRSGRKGRNKTIWGWHPDAQVRRNRQSAG